MQLVSVLASGKRHYYMSLDVALAAARRTSGTFRLEGQMPFWVGLRLWVFGRRNTI